MDDAPAAGGSVVVAEALRRRRTQERARWEAFQQRKRETEGVGGSGNDHHETPRAWWAPRRDVPRTADDGTGRRVGDVTDQPSTSAMRDSPAAAPRETPVTNTPSDDTPNTYVDPDELPSCRICFSGAEAGRLFSPCRCRGTMKHVHVHCLDAWRRASASRSSGGVGRGRPAGANANANENGNAHPVQQNRDLRAGSYVACDQCHFRYRLARSEWAASLEDKRLPSFVAVFVLLVAVFLVGGIARVVTENVALPVCARVARALRRAPERYAPFVTGETEVFKRVRRFFQRLALHRPDHTFRTRLWRATEASGSVGDTNPLRQHFSRVVRNAMEVWSSLDETQELSGTSPLHGACRGFPKSRHCSARVRPTVYSYTLRSTPILETEETDTFHVPIAVEFLFYKLTGWRSPAWWNPVEGPRWMVHREWVANFCDQLVCGMCVISTAGFAAHLSQQYNQYRNDNFQNGAMQRVFMPIAATFISRGTGASRLLLAGGLFWCAVSLHEKTKEFATRVLQKFGERVLEPTTAELRVE